MGYEKNLLFDEFSKKLNEDNMFTNKQNISRTIIYWAKSQADSKSNMQHKKDNNIKEDNLLSIKNHLNMNSLQPAQN